MSPDRYTYDTNSDLLIERYKNGIRLAKPIVQDVVMVNSIVNLASMPLGMLFKDLNSQYVMGNTVIAEIVGADSTDDLIGLSADTLCNREFAESNNENDIKIISSQAMAIMEEAGKCNDILKQAIAIKFPWYADDKIVGTLGFSINIDSHSLPHFASTMTNFMSTGLLGSTQSLSIPSMQHDAVYFTKRELDVLNFLVKGMSAKAIAEKLSRSTRTIEHHIENMKLKANCDSTFELIDKFYWKTRK